jgi:hypothetical protein
MMKTIISLFILSIMGLIVADTFKPSSKSTVSLIGGVIKARHSVETDKKYPRKDCPVCKGTGKYLSGDGIKMVDCGYCEVPKADSRQNHTSIPIIKK